MAILPKGRREREREHRRGDESETGREEVPVARRALVGDASTPKAAGPPPHCRQSDDVEDGGEPDDADGKGPHVVTVAECERSTGGTRARELETDEDARSGEDDTAPREVAGERSAQRRASSVLRRPASAASRPVMRRYSKKR